MINVMKNKLRAGMGIKNPIVMVDPDEVEDKYEKMATSDEMKTSCEENNLSITDTIKKIVSEGLPKEEVQTVDENLKDVVDKVTRTSFQSGLERMV